MPDKTFNLADLLDWLEALLEHRNEHVGEWCMVFATDERYVELNITDEEIWGGAVTNCNLSPAEWLSDTDDMTMRLLGWPPEELDGPEPKYVRRWPGNAPTDQIVSQILRVFTLVYLDAEAEVVEVVRGSFADGLADWESQL